MSSLEIAERTGKDHKNVMRDVRAMFDHLDIAGLSFERSYKDSTGRSLPCFHLPKRETLILVSGYSVELRAAIIDRWQELEALQAPRIPTHVEALRLAADAIERADLLWWSSVFCGRQPRNPVPMVGAPRLGWTVCQTWWRRETRRVHNICVSPMQSISPLQLSISHRTILKRQDQPGIMPHVQQTALQG